MAVPLFFWEFSKSIIHQNHDGSHTANSAFRTVFEGSGYNFSLVDFSPAVEWEGFGKGSTRMELFKRILDRYNYEFEIQGKTVYMHHQVGNDTNFIYKHKLNASNITESINATEYFTYIRGFGDYDEGEEDYYNNAKLKDDFLHPIAEVVGVWEGPPIRDGRIKNIETLNAAMKKAVEESLLITIEGTLHDIRQIYDVAVPQKGDRVWLQDDRIELENEIRLYKIVTTEDERGKIIKCDVTFGSQSPGDAYKASLNSLSKRFADLLLGKLKLPVISLEQVGMDMINAIHAASSEIIFGDFGMMAISKDNPNNVFGVNSEGWYISQDGGRTPKVIATAKGILADALFAGTLWLTNDMNIESADGYLNVTGSRFVMRSKTNSNNAVEITPDGISIYGFDGRELFINGIMRGSHTAHLQPFNNDNEMDGYGRWMYGNPQDFSSVYVIWDEYKGRYLNISGSAMVREGSPISDMYIDIQIIQALVGVERVLYTERKYIDRDFGNPERYSFNALVDMQAFFENIPDYRAVELYVQVKSTSTIENQRFNFRANRGRQYG